MRTIGIALLCFSFCCCGLAQSGPTDPKAKKTYDEAQNLLRRRQYLFAREAFQKADKQDGGKCIDCESQAYKICIQTGNYKEAAESAQRLIAQLHQPAALAHAHVLRGVALYREAFDHHKDKLFPEADTELKAALSINPKLASALYFDGLILAGMKQDDAAHAQFQQVVALADAGSTEQKRSQRYLDHPELARARMAPAFTMKTIDNREVSLDDLAGKVVLIDFWATWCGPCREALPHVRDIARKFAGEPLVVLSVSLDRDSDDQKWRDFVAKNEMTWLQARDGGFDGPVATLFAVAAIPHTFTIDADGVLQDEHIGDASIEGKLKKQIARARELQKSNTAKGQ